MTPLESFLIFAVVAVAFGFLVRHLLVKSGDVKDLKSDVNAAVAPVVNAADAVAVAAKDVTHPASN